MQDDQRAGAFALLAGSAIYLLVALLHPTRATDHGLLHGISVSEVLHAIALLAGPLFLFGFLILAQRQGLERPPVLLALVFYGVGAVVGMLPPAISGLVAPRVFEASDAASEEALLHRLGDMAFWLNQAFSAVHYTMMSIALLLVCAAWRGRGALDGALRVWGLLAGAGVLGWQVFGGGRVDVHVLGAVVLAFGGWHVLAAAWLLRRREEPPAA
jgi:hypothetical protein